MSKNVVQRPAASDQTYDRIRHDIVSGGLNGHVRLTEQSPTLIYRHHQELVDANVSRSPHWAKSVMSSHILTSHVTAQENTADKKHNSVAASLKDVG